MPVYQRGYGKHGTGLNRCGRNQRWFTKTSRTIRDNGFIHYLDFHDGNGNTCIPGINHIDCQIDPHCAEIERKSIVSKCKVSLGDLIRTRLTCPAHYFLCQFDFRPSLD
jgi:hypothetical protein